VLKITRLTHKRPGLTIKVEGEILEPWVSSVRDDCAPQGRRSEPLCLDLAAVTYADAAGVQLLRDLLREGVEIAACSSFVAELLHLGD
jgi:anti-anti-sigma regulatory factor